VSRAVPRRAARARRTRDAPARAPEILTRLRAAYPDAQCALDHRGAFQLLCATILSAQCTDARVNLVTPVLFARYPTAEALARAKQADVEAIIKSTGFFRNKAKSLIGMAQALVADHGGEVPRTMEQLRRLPGVGRTLAWTDRIVFSANDVFGDSDDVVLGNGTLPFDLLKEQVNQYVAKVAQGN